MRYPRLAALLVPVVAAGVLAAAPSLRKDHNGIYAVIDSAIVQPASGTPERLQLWGSFAFADVITVKDGKIESLQLGFFHPPKRGFMYYTVNRKDEAATHADWALLRRAAGTGRLVAWGAHLPPMDRQGARSLDSTAARIILTYNGRLRNAGEPLSAPDTFPERMPGWEKARNLVRSPAQMGFQVPDTARARSVAPPPELEPSNEE